MWKLHFIRFYQKDQQYTLEPTNQDKSVIPLRFKGYGLYFCLSLLPLIIVLHLEDCPSMHFLGNLADGAIYRRTYCSRATAPNSVKCYFRCPSDLIITYWTF